MFIQKINDQSDRFFWLCAGLIVIISLTGVFMNISGSLKLDEPFSANLVHLPWAEMVRIFQGDPSAPLYYTLLKLWVSCFGDSEVALRSLSAIFFAATVVVIGITAKKIDGASAGLTGALLASSSSVGLIFAGTARPYALLSLLTAISTLLLFYILGLIGMNGVPRHRQVLLLVGFVAVNVMGLLTHPIFIFLMIGFNSVAWIKGRRDFWLVALCNLFIIGIYLAIWGPFFLRTIKLPAINWMEVPDLKDLIHAYLNLWGITNTILLAVLILFGSVVSFRTIRDFVLSRSGLISTGMLLTTSVVPFLVSQYKPVFDDSRAPALFFPIACLILALIISQFRNLWLVFGILVLMLGNVILASVIDRVYAGAESSPKSSIQHVLEDAGCGDIIISGGLSINETAYYLRRLHAPDCIEHRSFPKSMQDHPGWMDAPTLLKHSDELVMEAKVLVSDLEQRHGRVWYLYESKAIRRPVLDILKNELDRKMMLVQSMDGYGSFFDSVLVYSSKK